MPSYIAAMYHRQHLQSAITICNVYNGDVPFAAFIKQYFKAHRQFGSKDRKAISHFCYCSFRTGKALLQASVEERIITGLFLCSDAPNETLATLRPNWNELAALPLPQKLAHAGIQSADVFPYTDALAPGIDAEAFALSFFTQPDLFLRLRPGHEAAVLQKLQQAGLQPRQVADYCIALPNHTKADTLLQPDAEAVVQDYSSQQTGQLMQQAFNMMSKPRPAVWDCCAASGGKSLLLYDLCPTLQLTASDLRPSILANLHKRFAAAGIRHYTSFTANLAAAPAQANAYDLIVADVPCSGSGTWARTPEQLFYFDAAAIAQYAHKQQQILGHIVPSMKAGALLLYITCSVFAAENEAAVQFLQEAHGMELVKMQTFAGYHQKADTLFGALLKKPM